jgi:hypothetical protein
VTPQQLQAIRDDWASVDPTSKTMLLMREDVYAVLNGYDALAAELAGQVAWKERYMREVLEAADRIRELEADIRWVLNDAAYKPPEAIGQVAQRWVDRLRSAMTSFDGEGDASNT